MFYKEIETLLHKSIGELPRMICNRNIRHDIDELVGMVLPGMSLAIVDDNQTADALGNQVFRALSGRHRCQRLTLPGDAKADDATTGSIRTAAAACDALIGVGSGTINDLCKHASHTDGKPYIIFPTAASMNGYLSANASITVDGYKKTLPAAMPRAVFCDLSVIAAAPPRLAASGFGDSLARSTAQSDWLLSHLLLGTPYNDVPFELLAPLEPQLLAQARGIAGGDMTSIELLMHTLLLSGLGMTIAGGSYPASQGEHMIAHAHEMLHASPQKTFHGEEIAVTTLYMAKLQEQLLHRRPALTRRAFDAAEVARLFGARVAAEAKDAYAIKEKHIETALAAGAAHWDDIAHRIQTIALSPQQIAGALRAAGAPDAPERLGWTMADFAAASANAPFLRDRFTFLDLNTNNN